MEDWLYQHAAIGTLVTVNQVSQILQHNFTSLRFYDKLLVYRDINQAWGCYHNTAETNKENGDLAVDESLWEPIQDLITALEKNIIANWCYGDQGATV